MIYLQKMLNDGDGRKPSKYRNDNKEKIPRLITLPSPVYKIEANFFPVPENPENKHDLP